MDLTSEFDTAAFDAGSTRSEEGLVRALALSQRKKGAIQFYQHRVVNNPERRVAQLKKHGLQIRNNPALYPRPPVDWAANPNEDDNWLFQKNALYVLAPTIQVHAQSGVEVHLGVAKELLLDWIHYNLELDKPNRFKWYDMGAGLRAALLAYVVDAELRLNEVDVDALPRLIKASLEHAAVLAEPENLAAGNHAYFQLVGLMSICQALPSAQKCPEYVSYANTQLDVVIASQFSREGVHREHAPEYHFFSLARLEQILATGWFELSEDSMERLERAREIGPWLRRPDGTIAMIGDSEPKQPRLDGFKRVMQTTQNKSFGRSFPNSGYAVLRSPWASALPKQHAYLIFWAGDELPGEKEPHSYGHSHADDFTFEWDDRGLPVLVDSGKYSYGLDKWRKYFVSTRAHNTIEVDEKDLTNAGYGACPPRIVSTSSDEPLQHVQAYAVRCRSGVEHRRFLVLNPGNWLVVIDRVSDKIEHEYTQWFHFQEDWYVEKAGGFFRGVHPQATLHIQNLTPETVDVHNLRGAISPRIQGWISRRYQERVPNTALGFSQQGKQVDFVTLFLWDSTGQPVVELERIVTEDEILLCWSDGQSSEGFHFQSGSAPVLLNCAD